MAKNSVINSRKASKLELRKCFRLAVNKWTYYSKRDQLGAWRTLWCNVVVNVRLIGMKKKKITHIWLLFYVVIWMRTVSCFTILLWHSFLNRFCDYKSCNSRDLFNKFSSFCFLGTIFLARKSCHRRANMPLITGHSTFLEKRDHSFSTFAKFSKKLTFFTPWYIHVWVRIRG